MKRCTVVACVFGAYFSYIGGVYACLSVSPESVFQHNYTDARGVHQRSSVTFRSFSRVDFWSEYERVKNACRYNSERIYSTKFLPFFPPRISSEEKRQIQQNYEQKVESQRVKQINYRNACQWHFADHVASMQGKWCLVMNK